MINKMPGTAQSQTGKSKTSVEREYFAIIREADGKIRKEPITALRTFEWQGYHFVVHKSPGEYPMWDYTVTDADTGLAVAHDDGPLKVKKIALEVLNSHGAEEYKQYKADMIAKYNLPQPAASK